ncbi:MAG: bacillithiol biosynthesis deacetylase BshB1 [Bacilli bacterium]
MRNWDTDFLIFSAHPDDCEIGMGGSIAKYSKKGYKMVSCCLTYAELSSNGNVNTRQKEKQDAARKLGISELLQLDIPDRGISLHSKYIQQVTNIIRMYKPRYVFSPARNDRHPDHGAATNLVSEAIFNARIRKYKTSYNDTHVVSNHFLYCINGVHTPDFYVDISCSIEQKRSALHAYASQFMPADGVVTPLTMDYVDATIARDKIFGKEITASYAEGFYAEQSLRFEF